MFVRSFHLTLFAACLCAVSVQAQHRMAPPGMFKDLDDEIAGAAPILHGKQLFIDAYDAPFVSIAGQAVPDIVHSLIHLPRR